LQFDMHNRRRVLRRMLDAASGLTPSAPSRMINAISMPNTIECLAYY